MALQHIQNLLSRNHGCKEGLGDSVPDFSKPTKGSDAFSEGLSHEFSYEFRINSTSGTESDKSHYSYQRRTGMFFYNDGQPILENSSGQPFFLFVRLEGFEVGG
jgi:hypothetical protein